jgi:hypothetical protein
MKKTITAGVCALICASGSFADVANLVAAQDTTIWNRDGHAWQDVNSGSETSLDLHNESSGGINAFTYIQFDLSSLGAITLNSASMSIVQISPNPIDPGIGSTRSSGTASWSSGRINFWGMENVAGNTAQNWSENTLTFNLAGSELDETSADNMTTPFNAGTVADFSALDSTDGGNNSVAGTDTSVLSDASVTAWLQGRIDDNGLATFIVDMGESQNSGIFSKEGAADFGDMGVAPTLALDYTAIPEPATLGLIAMSSVGLLVARRFRM